MPARSTRLLVAASSLLLATCSTTPAPEAGAAGASGTPATYHDTTGRKDILGGGARMIPITTPKGTFNVWTKRVGNNLTIKVLLLHGGPGMTHEYWEAADSYFPGAGVEYYYYALAHQKNLKGLVISNMMSSIPAYNEYARKEYSSPRYMELLIPHHYQQHVVRIPPDKWPDPVNRAFKHVNADIYVPMQGPSELGASGKVAQWDRRAGPGSAEPVLGAAKLAGILMNLRLGGQPG
jgi:proline iminopeptidase